MTYIIVIPGRLPSLNDYISAERSSKYRAAKMKLENEEFIRYCIGQTRIPHIKRPVFLTYDFFEQSKRRDKDNISGLAHKFVQDALVASRVIDGDGWDHIDGYRDHFHIDKKNPRIEVAVQEV